MAEAQLRPGASVDDVEAMDEVLEGEAALAQRGVVEEEAFAVAVLEQQPPGLSLSDEVESQLGGATGTHRALGTAPVWLGGGPQAVEGAASRFAVVVAGTGVAVAQDASMQVGSKALLGVEQEAARAQLEEVHGGVL